MVFIRKNYNRIFWIALLLVLALGIGNIALSSNRPSGGLIINEFMASNRSGITDEYGETPDWIEIYNPGPGSINLAGWALTDNPDQPQKWSFPDKSLGSGEYLVVLASGKNGVSGEVLHASFQLDRDGEYLALYNSLTDELMPVEITPGTQQFSDVAYGRPGNGSSYGYLTTATPGQPNVDTLLWQGVVADVEYSTQRGFIDEPFSLALTSSTPDAEIFYTLDGSQPTETNGLVYSEPIAINSTTVVRAMATKPNFRPSTITTHSYVFLDNVLTQSATPPPGFPDTWGIYRKTYKHAVEGEPAPADYEMDPEIVNDPRYRDTIKDDLKSIPSLFISMEPEDFDIYSSPRERGREWERPVSIEFVDPHKPEWEIQSDAGLRIQGDIGREEFIPKHSFRLFFRNEYGPGELEFPLFSDSPVDEFNTLTLRGGVQSSYNSVWVNRRRITTYTRDQWLRKSQLEMSGIGSHGTFVHLYLNGIYWGLYNIVERPDKAFAESYYKVDENNWYAFNHDGPIDGEFDTLKATLAGFIEGASDEERIAAIKQHFDLVNFADYMILNWYAGTHDWPNGNWYAGFELPDGKIRYFVWDGELIWYNGAKIDFGISNPPGYLWPNTAEVVFKQLIQDPDFKILLADRTYKHLFNDGVLSTEKSQARWQEINSVINRAIVGESARWGDTREERPLDREDWLKSVEDVLLLMEGNSEQYIDQARELGYYPAIDPPQFNKHGGLVDKNFELAMSATEGEIYYTTNGVDPRVAGSGDMSPDAAMYNTPLKFTDTTQVKARAFNGTEWSALAETTFSVVPQDQKLRITELMYNPPGSGDYEFIELQNVGNAAVDVSGMSFEGIEFKFPANSVLASGQVAVLVANPETFAEKYPDVFISGVYSGQLSNGGEAIILKDSAENTVISMSYDDENYWPVSPDGRGDSLILIDVDGDPNNPKSWRASLNPGGSPGEK